MLTARRRPLPPAIAPRQAHRSWQAWRNTQRPSFSIWPHSSTTWMKRAGMSMPASGWRQRTSASTPSRLRLPRSTIG